MAPGAGIVSVTGRVGQVPALQYDIHTLTYATENKHIRLNATWLGWWIKIQARALAVGKEACLRIDPSNKPSVPVLHIISEARHAALLACERRERERVMPPAPSQATPEGDRD